ncbi:MAG: trypsin-like peptidase domain-containing protein [Patescibacteria group bacterium]
MKKYAPFMFIIALIVASDIGGLILYKKEVSKQQQSGAASIASLQKELATLQAQLALVSKQQSTVGMSAQEVVTSAVSKTTPSVVSIVISENVPKYKVVYKNPFGNDPFFKDIGIQVPVYEPTGETQSQKVGAGTGFIISTDGYILTNKHVVADDKASYTVLLSNGKQQTAQVIYRDPSKDIAIIKITGVNYQPVKFGDASSLKLGQTVIAIGNALGEYNNTVSMGVISGLNRTIQASSPDGRSETLTGVIQTDAAINPGNSGGPLLDLNGNVVGINVATVQGSSNISFSIPESTFRSIIKAAINR